MGYYHLPPDAIAAKGRRLHGNDYWGLRSQLRGDEQLFGIYTWLTFKAAPWLFSEDEFARLEAAEAERRVGGVARTFYAVSEESARPGMSEPDCFESVRRTQGQARKIVMRQWRGTRLALCIFVAAIIGWHGLSRWAVAGIPSGWDQVVVIAGWIVLGIPLSILLCGFAAKILGVRQRG